MNKLVKIQSETLLSRHSLSVQVLLRGNFQTLHRLFFFFEEDILFQVLIYSFLINIVPV